MGYIKFSFLVTSLALSFSVLAQERFSSKSCLDANFELNMSNRGLLFGLLNQELGIDKRDCIIKVKHKKYLTKEWIVDICREPIHIKVNNATGIEVAKKTMSCSSAEYTSDGFNFCDQVNEVLNRIQDDGLIFAEGDRDSLNSDHGKTYCAYLLLKKYLDDGVLFSRYTEVPDIFNQSALKAKETVLPIESKTVEEVKVEVPVVE